jgi:response regulator RpfG family c-di-GMP phosphodiesterase
MPGMTGLELVRRLREHAPCAHLKIIMFSGHMDGNEMAQLLEAGVDDYLTKPFSGTQLTARIKACLGHKRAEDRSDQLTSLLLNTNAELEKNLDARDGDLMDTRNALVLAMARIVDHRNTVKGAHLVRMQQFCRCLAEEAARLPLFAATINSDFIHMLECCVPLHDVGMVTLLDDILLKPGKLTAEERVFMQQHTTVGANTLQEVARQHGSLAAFMRMASDVARHHHEHFDGNGYPDRLQGGSIPLSARIAGLADVYDALRSRRIYRAAMSHKSAVQIMTTISEGHFDPSLIPVFERCAPRLEVIFRQLGD